METPKEGTQSGRVLLAVADLLSRAATDAKRAIFAPWALEHQLVEGVRKTALEVQLFGGLKVGLAALDQDSRVYWSGEDARENRGSHWVVLPLDGIDNAECGIASCGCLLARVSTTGHINVCGAADIASGRVFVADQRNSILRSIDPIYGQAVDQSDWTVPVTEASGRSSVSILAADEAIDTSEMRAVLANPARLFDLRSPITDFFMLLAGATDRTSLRLDGGIEALAIEQLALRCGLRTKLLTTGSADQEKRWAVISRPLG